MSLLKEWLLDYGNLKKSKELQGWIETYMLMLKNTNKKPSEIKASFKDKRESEEINGFKELKEYWYKETNNNTEGDPLYAVCANKYDLYQKQTVKTEQGKQFADEIHAIFQNTSATSYTGINMLFENLGKKIINPKFDYKKGDKESIKISKNDKNNKEGKKDCC